MVLTLLSSLLACHGDVPAPKGVYHSGADAVARGVAPGPVKVWGPAGTQERTATAGKDGTVTLDASGPVWIVDHDVPAPAKANPVDAKYVESASFHLKELLVPAGSAPAVAGAAPPDAARTGGVYVRSMVKVRREMAPPIYVVTATGDEVGAGRFDGPKDVRTGENCRAAIAVMDAKVEKRLYGALLDAATKVCAVPVLLPPVDLDGDGVLDVLVYGQNGTKGFRSWFRIVGDELVPGATDSWEAIP
jgi:hypothetical protein